MDWSACYIVVLFLSTRGKKRVLSTKTINGFGLLLAVRYFGAVSGLYDKFIIARIDRIAVQAWFSFYQVVILLPILGIFWFPVEKKPLLFDGDGQFPPLA
ncbi:MAG: hypothetical protein IPF54_25540 [Draconibacterium sp.]|nr:hypothetical protein [Draconibacterium sp.]